MPPANRALPAKARSATEERTRRVSGTPTLPTPEPLTEIPLESLTARAQALLDAPTAQRAFALYAADIHAHGFTHCFAARISSALLTDLSLAPFVFLSPGTPALDNYIRDGFFANDPVMERARLTNRPFRWREVYSDMDAQQARTVELFREFGLSHGFCVPIDRTRGVAGIASMGRSDDFALTRESRIEIEVLSRHLFERLDQLLENPDTKPLSLTPRERAVLILVGEGKTNWEIGEILSVSEYSVRDYMRNMSEKLQTTNRTHTVVRAVQLGLIAV